MSLTEKIKIYRSNERLVMEVNDDSKEIGIDLDYVINDNASGSEDGQTVILINKANTDQKWEVVFGGIVDETDTTVGATKTLISDYLSTVTKAYGDSSSGGGLDTQSATLLKTGQTTSYRTGDDGDLEAGRATDFSTLPGNNPFGNTNRFTDELGGQAYSNTIIIDWSTYDGSTVLGYSNFYTTSGSYTWEQSVDNSLIFSTGGFSGWRLANLREYGNIANFNATNVYSYAPFNIGNIQLHCSTTNPTNTSQAFWVITSSGQWSVLAKGTAAGRFMPVRTFTVSGTTLT